MNFQEKEILSAIEEEGGTCTPCRLIKPKIKAPEIRTRTECGFHRNANETRNPHGVRVPPKVETQGERHACPRRLHHETPSWCRGGAVFHIRLRVAPDNLLLLTQPDIAKKLLAAARFYHEKQRWWCSLFLLMPDHVHALLAFPADGIMSRVVGDWKRYTAQKPGVRWQVNYFDHRIRHHSELAAKYAYICRNPVVKGLCPDVSAWPWVWQSMA